jgi:hypothetical protein
MMAKAQPDASGTKIETHVDNDTLTFALSVPEETLKKALEQQRGAIAQAIAQVQGQQASLGQAPAPALAARPCRTGPRRR